MTTRQQFRDTALRSILENTAVFPDTLLNSWISEAIRDYSMHFPKEVQGTLQASKDGQRTFVLLGLADLAEVYGITRVEYPIDLEPPSMLSRLPRDHPGFEGGPYYDLVGEHEIMLGQAVPLGATINIWYNTVHLAPTSDTMSLSIPGKHLEALKMYCVWQAVRKLEMDQSAEPDMTSLLLSMLGTNSGRAERAYRSKIREYLETTGGGQYSGPWRMDKWDGGY